MVGDKLVGEGVIEEILVYLKKEGPTNTFRLARAIGIERYKLLNLLKRLEEKQAIRLEHGNALFIKFTSEEKSKPVEIKKFSLQPRKRVERGAKSEALRLLQVENKQLRKQIVESEEAIKELGKKVSASPKIITKTIIKKIPVTVIKTIIKKVPASQRPLKKKIWEKLKTHSKRFKIPKFKLLENIQQLKRPEFIRGIK